MSRPLLGGSVIRGFTVYLFSSLAKSAPIPEENACEPDLSVVSFLPWLALMKITVLESMRTLFFISGWTPYHRASRSAA